VTGGLEAERRRLLPAHAREPDQAVPAEEQHQHTGGARHEQVVEERDHVAAAECADQPVARVPQEVDSGNQEVHLDQRLADAQPVPLL